MGCKGSKHALHGGGGVAAQARAPEPRRSSTMGTLSLDRAAAAATVSLAGEGEEEMMMKSGDEIGGTGSYRPATRPVVASGGSYCSAKRQKRTPTKTPMRDPEEINVWELMEGLEDDEGDSDGVERQVMSLPGSPVFDPDSLAAFGESLGELSPPPAPPETVNKDKIQMLAGVVPSRIDVFQQKIDAKLVQEAPQPPPPPPDSTRRVIVYLTSLRGIRQTHEDCCTVSAILRSYGVRVDDRDLSMHAGYKDELHSALAIQPRHGGLRLPQVFVDGLYLGDPDDVRRMHESGELAEALQGCCDLVVDAGCGKPGGGLIASEPCGGCGGARFLPCDECSGSCKVFAVDEDGGGGGAFRRCPHCNENGLIRCPIC